MENDDFLQLVKDSICMGNCDLNGRGYWEVLAIDTCRKLNGDIMLLGGWSRPRQHINRKFQPL